MAGRTVRYVAFLRAINVAGHATVRMDRLTQAFAEAGCREVTTYIQSGNVLYEAAAAEQRVRAGEITRRVSDMLGGEAIVIFRTLRHLRELVRDNPFPEKDRGPEVKRYIGFLARSPRRWPAWPIEDEKEHLRLFGRRDRNVFVVSGRKENGFYGFPNACLERELGVAATSRNWNTVVKIVGKFGPS